MTGSGPDQDPIEEQAIDWLLKIAAAPDDAVLRAALAAWRARSPAHEQAYRSVARVWRLAAALPRDYAAQVKTAQPPPPAKRRRKAMGMMATAVAASLAIVLATVLATVVAPAVQIRIATDYVTGTGEIREIVLGEASRVRLDGASAVAVRYGPAGREVRLLAGEAFFEVAPVPTRPFIVHVNGITVTVTGTAFAVGTDPDWTTLAVQSGAVAIALGSPSRTVVRLVAGDRLSVVRATGAVTRSTVAPADVATWRAGRLVVDGVPLAELVAQLRRHHRGVIWLNGAALAEHRITGVFDLSDPVAALRAAAATQGAEVITLTPYLVIVTPRRDL